MKPRSYFEHVGEKLNSLMLLSRAIDSLQHFYGTQLWGIT